MTFLIGILECHAAQGLTEVPSISAMNNTPSHQNDSFSNKSSPKSCSTNSVFYAIPNKKIFLAGYTIYSYTLNPVSCRDGYDGRWIINSAPKYGTVSRSPHYAKPCSICSKQFLSSAGIYYTWTSTDPKAKEDSFSATWHSNLSYLPDDTRIKRSFTIIKDTTGSHSVKISPLIANQLIDKFEHNDTSNGAKKEIMRVLANLYGLDRSKSAPKITQKSIAIQDFFTQQIQNITSKSVFKQAITLYPIVSSAEDMWLLDDSLVKYQDLLSTQEIFSIRLNSALAAHNVQENSLPQLLRDVQNSSVTSEIKQEFNNHLFSLLITPYAESVISDTTKPSVVQYIQAQEPTLTTLNVSFNSLNDYSAWLESYAAMSSSQGDKQNFIINYAVNSATPIQKAAIVLFADDNLVSQLQQNSYLQDNLQKELANAELSEEAKRIMQYAIQRLQAG